MRCLYCGKELALLKRLRGGGEFCSDAHRQQYQEEYNQLALSRLLQAKPVEDAKPAPLLPQHPIAEEPEPVPVSTLAHAEPVHDLQPAYAQAERASAEKPLREALPEPEPEKPVEVQAPAPMANWITDRPALMTLEKAAPVVNLELVMTLMPSIPARAVELARADGIENLPMAGKLALQSAAPAGMAIQANASTVEPREFSHKAEIVTVRLDAQQLETGTFPASSRVEVDRGEFVAPTGASLWSGEAFSFAAPAVELGELGRLPYMIVRGGEPVAEVSVAHAVVAPAAEALVENAAPVRALPEPEPIQEPAQTERVPMSRFAPANAERIRKAPRHLDRVRIEPVLVTLAGIELAGELTESIADASSPVEPEQRTPVAETQPIPLEFDPVAAERGRPVQVWTTGITPAGEIQIPFSGSMPLRPVMIVVREMPPAEASAETEAAKPEAVKPEAALAKQEAKPETKSQARVQSKAQGVAGAPARSESAARQERRLGAKAEAKPEPPRPAKPTPRPVSPPTSDVDLGLPALHLSSSPGFWGRLPLAARIGIAVVILAVISGVFYLATNGTSANANVKAPQEILEAGLPISNATWVENWAPDSTPGRGRRISLFSPVLPISDYRMEFEAQIESKALGWVYRAKDPKNYYATKIEVIKAGIQPELALIRFAVIGGQEEAPLQEPLQLGSRVDTLYKIRFDAIGDRFTLSIGDQKISEWTDSRLPTGSVGLFNERGEVALVKGSVRVMPLVKREAGASGKR